MVPGRTTTGGWPPGRTVLCRGAKVLTTHAKKLERMAYTAKRIEVAHRRQQLVVGPQVHDHQHLAIARSIHLLCIFVCVEE